MNRIKTLIVDDESLAREDLAALLRADADLEIVACCADGDAAVRALTTEPIELLFLDIQMPGLTGFDVLTKLPPSRRPHVVFVTAYDEFAARAFEVGAVDYLSKPFTRKRLKETLQRAKSVVRGQDRHELVSRIDSVMAELNRLRALNSPDATRAAVAPPKTPVGVAPSESEGDGRLLFRSDGELHVCTPAEIRWVETVGDYVKLHLGEKSRLVRMTMLNLMTKLNSRHFVRIHRSTTVNLAHIRKVTPSQYGEYVVELHDGTKLKVSRTYMADLRAAL
ncbi:MAG: DNA-binding response regulator [Opitutus sp.]|nr:DNA-binding response regulator [Opitutus sp.]